MWVSGKLNTLKKWYDEISWKYFLYDNIILAPKFQDILNKKIFWKWGVFIMQKYVLYVGLNDKKTKIQEISTLQAYKIITNVIVANKVDGFTILEANGYYVHSDKTISIEKSLKIEFLFIDIDVIKNIIKDLKRILNQESIILQTENITSELM